MKEITPIKELRKQVQVVAKARKELREAKDIVNVARTKWEEENAPIIEEAEGVGILLGEEEALLRKFTLQAYAQTGNKKPAEGVGVREVTKMEYDLKEAYQWALKHQMALALDSKAFEKIAKADTMDFVRIYIENQATIATNLEIGEEKE